MKKEFTKQDLDLGMYVVTRSKGTGLVIKGINDEGFDIYNVKTGEYLMRDIHLHDDLTCDNGNYDIIEIYSDFTMKSKLWVRDSKITLTKEEEIILSCVSEYKYITRDQNGDLWLWNKAPEKQCLSWRFPSKFIDYNVKCCGFKCYNHLFKFVKWSDKEPCLISNLV